MKVGDLVRWTKNDPCQGSVGFVIKVWDEPCGEWGTIDVRWFDKSTGTELHMENLEIINASG